MTVEAEDTSCTRGKLREAQHGCEDCGEAVPTTIFRVTEQAREAT